MTQTGNIPPISVSEVCKTYRDGFKAVKKVSFDIKSGDFTDTRSKWCGQNFNDQYDHRPEPHQLRDNSYLRRRYCQKPISRKVAYGQSMPQEINFNPFSKIIDSLVFHGGYYGIPPEEVMRRAEPLLKRLACLKK